MSQGTREGQEIARSGDTLSDSADQPLQVSNRRQGTRERDPLCGIGHQLGDNGLASLELSQIANRLVDHTPQGPCAHRGLRLIEHAEQAALGAAGAQAAR